MILAGLRFGTEAKLPGPGDVCNKAREYPPVYSCSWPESRSTKYTPDAAFQREGVLRAIGCNRLLCSSALTRSINESAI